MPIFRQYGLKGHILVLFVLIFSIKLISCTIDDRSPIKTIHDNTLVPSETQQDAVTTTVKSNTFSTTPSTTTQSPEDLKISVQNTCFYSDEQLCTVPNVTEGALNVKCDCQLHPEYKKALFCCNVTDIDKALNCANVNLTDLQHLHIRNASVDEIDFSDAKWKFFETIAITDGKISRIPKDFYKFSQTKCLNMSNNGLTEISQRIVKNLMNLELLDISYNNLSSIPNTNGSQKNLTLNIKGNENMPCKSAHEVLGRGSINIIDPAKTFCLTTSKNWFDSPTSVSLSQLQRLKQLENECPKFDNDRKCICNVERVNYVNEEHVVFNARVDCSGLNLLTLPEKLPPDTITLDISNNSISSLLSFRTTESTYTPLQNLIADHNEISSILDLEGSTFIQHFDKLSLRHNKLKSIPIYLLSNTMDRNPQGAVVYLEGNQITCDCNAAKVLKIWLLARQSHISDYGKLECDSGIPVLSLSETKLCRSYVDWTDYIYLIIIVEILLLIALICKVSYDYYIFKTHGFLPWPASQIPKIPFCDWLCET